MAFEKENLTQWKSIIAQKTDYRKDLIIKKWNDQPVKVIIATIEEETGKTVSSYTFTEYEAIQLAHDILDLLEQ